jgi:hypothetical protein
MFLPERCKNPFRAAPEGLATIDRDIERVLRVTCVIPVWLLPAGYRYRARSPRHWGLFFSRWSALVNRKNIVALVTVTRAPALCRSAECPVVGR